SEIRYLNLLYRKHRGIRREDRKAAELPEEKAMNQKQGFKVLLSLLTDWQIFLQALIFMASSVSTYTLKFTLPQIMVAREFQLSAKERNNNNSSSSSSVSSSNSNSNSNSNSKATARQRQRQGRAAPLKAGATAHRLKCPHDLRHPRHHPRLGRHPVAVRPDR
ncbi:hypothetical protein, partial [Pseudoxanthomonas winnipegensis]|uniref:hypothetical protein n=1 Tax=Pseudoxanthomonas winnipegensis TaxID=2480810 RepID=UPI003F846E6A